MIGGLQYLTHTRPDIENAVGIVARFQDDPREAHYVVVKMMFSYLNETPEFGLWYEKSNYLNLYAYTNVDWASSIDDRKSTSGGEFFSWRKIRFMVKKEVGLYLTE